MNRSLITRLTVLMISLLSLLSCSRDGTVISRAKMSEIYAEMFLADQWINTHYESRRTADTTVVYAAVLDKYGYDVNDYRRSVEHYMQDPDRFARILRQSATIVEARVQELKHEQRKLLAAIPKNKVEFDFDRVLLIGRGTPRMVDRDSISFYKDSADISIFDPFFKLFEWDPQQRPPIAVLPEKLDSTTVADSLVVTDSLSQTDTLSLVTQPETFHRVDTIKSKPIHAKGVIRKSISSKH